MVEKNRTNHKVAAAFAGVLATGSVQADNVAPFAAIQKTLPNTVHWEETRQANVELHYEMMQNLLMRYDEATKLLKHSGKPVVFGAGSGYEGMQREQWGVKLNTDGSADVLVRHAQIENCPVGNLMGTGCLRVTQAAHINVHGKATQLKSGEWSLLPFGVPNNDEVTAFGHKVRLAAEDGAPTTTKLPPQPKP